jgi:hypothetical protein
MDNYLTSLRPSSWFLIFTLIIGVYIPGYVLTYIFVPALFFKLDWFKLSVIALSIPTPLVLVNSLLFAWHYIPVFRLFGDGNYTPTLIALLSAIASSIVLYILLCILFFFKVSIITFLIVAFVVQFIISLPIGLFGTIMTQQIEEIKKNLIR